MNRLIHRVVLLVSVFGLVAAGAMAGVKEMPDIPYRSGPALSAEEKKLCELDLYVPDGKVNGALLWLHGGSLTGGNRNSEAMKRVARRLAESGMIVASADYRLNPGVTFPAYIDDAAAALVWLRANVAKHGGDPAQVFIGGHSAGAYLALMVALDNRFAPIANAAGAPLAGVIAVSGQTISHFTVRAERGIPSERIVVDDAAPLNHVAKRDFPFLLLYGGSDLALRVEENRLLGAALRGAGTPVEEELFADRDHGTIVNRINEPDDAVAKRVLEFMTKAKTPAAVSPAPAGAPRS